MKSPRCDCHGGEKTGIDLLTSERDRQEQLMAKGKVCPMCGAYMYAESEKPAPAGTYVIYVCRSSSCGFKERVFEAN